MKTMNCKQLGGAFDMKELMKNPEAMKNWFENKKNEFEELQEE
jgi:hypothetical protein